MKPDNVTKEREKNRCPENFEGGVICINKPAGCSSHDVVGKLRRLFGTRQVGHTGTLDPMATGVLTVMIGRAVKASEYLTAENKAYVAGVRLGITTDTEPRYKKPDKDDGEDRVGNVDPH